MCRSVDTGRPHLHLHPRSDAVCAVVEGAGCRHDHAHDRSDGTLCRLKLCVGLAAPGVRWITIEDTAAAVPGHLSQPHSTRATARGELPVLCGMGSADQGLGSLFLPGQ